MNSQMLGIIAKRIEPFNPDIANGIALKQVPTAENYVDRDFRASSDQFPPDVKYLGLRRCTAMEEYKLLHQKKEKNYVELSRTDMTLYEAQFTYQDRPMESRYFYLPFAIEAGMMHVRGTEYMLSPVIGDVAVSVTRGGLFAWLGLTKVQFYRMNYQMYVDGTSYSGSVAHSNLYHRSSKSKAAKVGKNSLRSTLVHYMLCRMGLTEMMTKHFGCSSVLIGDASTINHDVLDLDEWTICSSSGMGGKPVRGEYFRSGLRVAIPSAAITADMLDALTGVFYVIDTYPDQVQLEYLENPQMWQRLMGRVIFGDTMNEGERMILLREHLISIDGYVNYQSRRTLHQGKIMVETIHEFFAWVIREMPFLISTAPTEVASLYGKRLMIVRYLLKDISRSIYLLMFRLRAQYNKKGRLSEKEVRDAMRKGLLRDRITVVNVNHAEVSTVSSPGDNKIFKITSTAVLQENTDSPRGKGGGGSLNDPSKFLHSSVIEFCSYCAMGKNEPTGRGKLGTNVRTNARGDLLRNEKHHNLLEYTQQLLTRK
jgi:hypothetical protein